MCDSNVFLDEYDAAKGSRTYAVWYEEKLVSSIRMHVLNKQHASSATFSAFPDLIEPLLSEGLTVVDGARFVVDNDLRDGRRTIARRTLDIASQVAEEENADFGVAAVQMSHIAFYQRAGGFKLLSEPRGYCGLDTELALVGVNFGSHDDE